MVRDRIALCLDLRRKRSLYNVPASLKGHTNDIFIHFHNNTSSTIAKGGKIKSKNHIIMRINHLKYLSGPNHRFVYVSVLRVLVGVSL